MIRIIGGCAKGRKLEVPLGRNTRPTSAVVREAVFGMLQPYIEDARVLDLFCGSGAYALEAISRGAANAVLVDKDARAAAIARNNAQLLGFSSDSKVVQSDYLQSARILQHNGEIFDIIFLDPPYAADVYVQAINACLPLLDQNGRIVCEHSCSIKIRDIEGLICDRTRRYGKRAITILVRRDGRDRNLSGQL